MIVAISSRTSLAGSSPVISQSIQTRYFLLRFGLLDCVTWPPFRCFAANWRRIPELLLSVDEAGASIIGASNEECCMRTTINLDEKLIEDARRMTGIQEKATLIHEGLR